MREKFNKAKVILYCVIFVVYLVSSAGILVFYVKTDDLDNIHYPLLFLMIITIGALVLIFTRSDKDNNKN